MNLLKRLNYAIGCQHETDVRIEKYFAPDGTPMIKTECWSCGHIDNGHVHTNNWENRLIVKRNGKIIIDEIKVV